MLTATSTTNYLYISLQTNNTNMVSICVVFGLHDFDKEGQGASFLCVSPDCFQVLQVFKFYVITIVLI